MSAAAEDVSQRCDASGETLLCTSALRYARAGYRILPLHSVNGGRCSCGRRDCHSPGKHPRTKNGAHDATAEPGAIREWWARWPDANIGLTLGGLVVLDEDPRNGGDLDALGQELPETCVARTGSGGRHFLYRAREGVRYPGHAAPGIDVKSGPGAFIVVEPSRHLSGQTYCWLDESEPWNVPPVLAPAWLHEVQTTVPQGGPSAVTEGGRNATLTSIGGRLRRAGLAGDVLAGALIGVNQTSCSPPLGESEVRRIAASLERYAVPDRRERALLVVVDYHQLLDHEIPPRERLLGDWLRSQSLAMVHAWRGVGKTYFLLGVAYSVAAGVPFLGWQAPKPRRVVYLDGEMQAAEMQTRLAAIGAAAPATPAKDMLQVITPDLQEDALPDLASPAGQEQLDAAIPEDTALVVVDNLSSLVRGSGAENDAEDWLAVQTWALRHRRLGRSVIFVHHSGKTGRQRGTSKREDLLDVVIQLRRPADYEESQGAVFELHFEKSRFLSGDAVHPVEARLVDVDGRQQWETRNVAAATHGEVVARHNLGLSVTDIANELGINKSVVVRHLDRAERDGQLTRPRRQQKGNAKATTKAQADEFTNNASE